MREKYIEIKKIIDESRVKFDEPMAKHTTLKVGGPADVMVVPESIADIQNTLKFAKENDIPVLVIGNGKYNNKSLIGNR